MNSRTVALVLSLVPTVAAGADLHYQSRPLSGSLEGAVVGETLFSPDDEWVVYWEGLGGSAGAGVYLARRWQGSAAIRLGVPQPSWGVIELRFSPDSRRLLYLRNTYDEGELWELRSAELDDVASGGARLGPIAPVDSVHDFLVTPDSSRVVFRSWRAGGLGHELFSVPIDGSEPPTRLHPEQPAWRGVEQFTLSDDGTRAVFRADFAANENFGLWSAPVDGSGPLVRLSPAPVPGGQGVGALPGFALGGDQAFFVGEFAPGDGPELWRRPIDASTPAVRLSPAGSSPTGVLAFEVVPASGRVLFSARLVDPGAVELYSVPWDGGATGAVRLDPESSVSGNPLREWRSSRDGSRALFCGIYSTIGIVDLYSVPIAGPSTGAVLLTPSAPAEGGQSESPFFDSTADGSRVVFSGWYGDPAMVGLWSVPIAGPAALAVRLERIGPALSTPEPQGFSGDYGRFLYLQERSLPTNMGWVRELWSAPVDGSAPSVRLHAALSEVPQRVDLVLPGLDDRVYFGATLGGAPNYPDELWVNSATAPLSEPVRLHPTLSGGDLLTEPIFAPDGLAAMFVADVLVASENQIWIADAVVFRADFDEEGDTAEWSATTP